MFSWLPELSYNDKGDCLYLYVPEDFQNVSNTLHEKNRLNGLAPCAITYLNRVRYGNKNPYYANDRGGMMDEDIFFKESGVSVSNVRFIVGEKTYVIRQLTSVTSCRQMPSRRGPCLLGFFGAVVMLDGGWAILIGLSIIAVAVFWGFSQKPRFSVLLSSTFGEMKVLTSADEEFITRVINAINIAIVHRGSL